MKPQTAPQFIHARAVPRKRSFASGSAFALTCLALAAGLSVFAPSFTRSAAQTAPLALTPLQREIEKQRALLSSDDVEKRRDAVMRLGAMRRADASRAAASALNDPAIIVRATAAHAVLSLPADEAAALIIPLLADRKEFVRRETAYALGETRSRTAVETLTTALARDKEAGVRGAAAVALGQIGDDRAVPALADILGRRVPSSGLFSRITRGQTAENEFVRRAAAVA